MGGNGQRNCHYMDGRQQHHAQRCCSHARFRARSIFKDRRGGLDYAALLSDLAAVRTANNAYAITVYCDNTQVTKAVEAFLTWSPAMNRIAGGAVLTDAFTITIEER